MNNRERAALRQQLLKKLRDSFVYSSDPIFTLSSGRKSHFYIDCKKVTLDAEGATWVGLLILDRIAELEVDAIGGMTLGADPIATAVSVLSYESGTPLSAFIIRKEPKGYGKQSFIEGNVGRETKVIVVDDVLTSGRATERTIRILQDAGCDVVKVIALVDRKEGGREHLEKFGFEVESLYTVEDLLKG
ncbi:MAG TPA: orotate phosphoribosyltransferase [Candidatus Manganitrophaceae bacterium]|nr:orotate phosphoribosyltransferase [Candidatus Manganitrophaceae bacterium]